MFDVCSFEAETPNDPGLRCAGACAGDGSIDRCLMVCRCLPGMLCCRDSRAWTMDVALHIQQFLSCHGIYATGALGDQKVPARRLWAFGSIFSRFAFFICVEFDGKSWEVNGFISSRSRYIENSGEKGHDQNINLGQLMPIMD